MVRTVDPLETVRDLAPLISRHADAIERERRLPGEVVDALVDAGVFRLFIPKVLGGAETDPMTACRVIEAVSAMDGATGWCAMISACYGLFAGLLPETAAHEVFGDQRAVVAGAFRTNGVAHVVTDGYRVTGRWPFGSGITHSTWVLGGCQIVEHDQPRRTAAGRPEVRLLFFPPGDVEILDTWHVAGLRGTGSQDYAVTDLFVPAHRACWFSQPPVQPGPLYAMPAIALFAPLVGCVALGIARHALAGFTELAGAKKPAGSQALLRDKPVAQAQLGEAEGLLRAGRAFLYETVAAAWETATRGGRLSWEQRGLLWLAATQAATQATQAVDLLFRAGGASSIYATLPLERCLRDIRTAAQHICVQATNYELAGQLFLGLEMGSSLWAIDDRGDA